MDDGIGLPVLLSVPRMLFEQKKSMESRKQGAKQMKKLFMEPELKITRFEYENIMNDVGFSSGAGFGDGNETDTDFGD